MRLPDALLTADRLAVITGAAGGVGEALARDLDAEGWATLRLDVAQATETSAAEFRHPSCFVQADVTDDRAMAEVGRLVAGSRAQFLGVAAAGVISASRVEDLSLAEWERVIRVNLTGTFLTLKALTQAARSARTGRLVAISSDAGKRGEAWLAHYSASKFGVIGLVQALALELVEQGVTVNAICPSIVNTPMMQQLAEQMAAATGTGAAEHWRETFVSEVAAGRACEPRDIAFLVRALADPGSEFLTGQSFNVSGGKVM